VAHGIDALCAGEPLPICLLGGLGPIYAARLARRYGARLRPARGSAIDGALELARRLT
jgi:glucosamine kinase